MINESGAIDDISEIAAGLTPEEEVAIQNTSLEDLLDGLDDVEETIDGVDEDPVRASELQPAMESMMNIVDSIRESGSISRTDAATLSHMTASLEGFQDSFASLPINSFTEIPSKVNYTASMENIASRVIKALVNALRAIIKFIRDKVKAAWKWLFGKKDQNAKVAAAAKKVGEEYKPVTAKDVAEDFLKAHETGADKSVQSMKPKLDLLREVKNKVEADEIVSEALARARDHHGLQKEREQVLPRIQTAVEDAMVTFNGSNKHRIKNIHLMGVSHGFFDHLYTLSDGLMDAVSQLDEYIDVRNFYINQARAFEKFANDSGIEMDKKDIRIVDKVSELSWEPDLPQSEIAENIRRYDHLVTPFFRAINETKKSQSRVDKLEFLEFVDIAGRQLVNISKTVRSADAWKRQLTLSQTLDKKMVVLEKAASSSQPQTWLSQIWIETANRFATNVNYAGSVLMQAYSLRNTVEEATVAISKMVNDAKTSSR